jgi:Leucine-rich repeat (LRR) protein
MNLSFNRLIEFSSPFLTLKSLTVLDLSHNQLLHLMGIEELTALIEIKLNHNQLQELPERMGELSNLQILLIEHNQIHHLSPTTNQQSIPAPILMNTRIDRLELAGNSLRKDELMSWQGMESYLERRKALGDKLFQGGILKIESNVCGLVE